MMRLCAISIDLDEIRHYYGIHALELAHAEPSEHAVYDIAVPRFRDFASAEGIPLTLFAVGADLARAINGRILRALAAGGHEIANHTFDHHYDLSRRSPGEIRDQITLANDALLQHTGERPVGFRTPGYVMSDSVYAAVADCGMEYSSSLFPCPYYHAAKLAVLGSFRLRGKVSESIAGGLEVLRAPRLPYRVGRPYWKRGSGVLELPIQVTPRLRLPFIGTNLTLLGATLARRMARSLVGEPFINLELHGVDLLDEHDHLSALAPHQLDLRLPIERKWAALCAVVEELRGAGYAFVRLDEAARQLAKVA
jgi:peptidoglycan/xylan/chitin deacetylase (PgdA/CDA1 family)